jgi:hypothetical protein
VAQTLLTVVTDARRVVMPGVIGITLGLALLAGTGRLPGGALSLLVATGVLAGMALIAVRLEWGLLLLPIVAVLVPFEIATGRQTPLVACLLLAPLLLGLWVARMLARRALIVVRSPVNLPLAGFVVTAVVATISSQVLRDPLVFVGQSFPQVQLGQLSVIAISAGLFFMVMNSFGTMRWLRWLTWLMIGLGAVTIAKYLLVPGGDLPFASVGGLFSLWVVSLAFGQALFNQRLRPSMRAALLLLAGLWLFRRLFLEFGWLSGWLPILLSLATICALRSWRALSIGVAVAALVAGLNYEFFAERYAQQVSGGDSQGNYQRFEVWRRAIEVMGDQLLLGLGPAGYAPYYMTYWPDQALSSHSNYLDILAQTGLVGSGFFFWFLGALYVVAVQARRRWPAGFPAGLASGALGGLVGMTAAMVLGDWVIPFAYNQTLAGFRYTLHNWIILGALAALPHLRGE